jgi:hypothetical protein
MSRANNLAGAESAADEKLAALSTGERELRRVGGHLFREENGVWTDLAHGDSLRVVTVAPFSAAYFAVVRALPELTVSLQTGSAVLIAGRKASLKVASGGRETLSAAEVREFVRQFRGV